MTRSGKTIQEPQVIAEIPQDITGSSSKVWASDVHAVAGLQKKKRSELALAVDRQGVNVYDVRQSKLVSSYAVPPQATFTCPPCSLRVRSTVGKPAQRFTFCSIRSPKPRLYCFSETLSSGLGPENPIATTAIDLEKDSSPITHLETISVVNSDDSGDSTDSLLATHRNGDVTCYNGRLEKEIWSSRANTGSGLHVLLAALTSIAQVKKGLLKHRGDVLASLGATEAGEESSLLVLLTRASDLHRSDENSQLALQIFNINFAGAAADNNGSAKSFRARLQKATSIDVPEPSHPTLQESTFALHVASGTLYQQTPGSMIVYDMTGLLPKVAHEMVSNKEDVSSFLRLSPFTLAMSRESSVTLIGLPYCSIQAESSVDDLPIADHGSLRLLSYIGPLNLVVAIQGRHVLAMQLPDSYSKSGTSHKRKREGVLIDSIGRGSCSNDQVHSAHGASSHSIKNLGTLLTSLEDKVWEDQKANLDEYSSNGGVEAVSNAMVEDFEMLNPGATTHLDQRKVSYLLSRTFAVNRDYSLADTKAGDGIRLKVEYLDRDNVLNWLLEKGLLTNDRVESSLKQEGLLIASERLATGAVIEALAKLDMSLGLLTSFLASQVPLRPEELASALVTVVQQWTNTGIPEEARLLTNSGSQSNRMQLENDNDHSSSQRHPLTTRTAASTHQLLHLILTRLAQLPQSTITSALRSHLTKPYLLALVDILRLEIARAGWLSPYDTSLSPPTASTTPNYQLANITHLLNSIIDAIGAGGWILGSGLNDDMTETADTIAYMRAEISAALEGIQEAVYLKGILGEVLLCGKEALSPTKIKYGSALASRNVPKTIALQDEESSALPLGLKLEKKVPLTKVGAGGELIGRSKRDIGRLKSKMVGKYSFERIIV